MVRSISIRFAGLFAVALGAVSCTRTADPCPSGSTASSKDDRCMSEGMSPSTAADGGVDGSLLDDGSIEHPAPSPVSDAGSDAGEPDGSKPGPLPSEDAGLDGAVVTPDPDADASAGDGQVAPSACESSDIAAWRAFHTSEGLVADIISCASDPACGRGTCMLDTCLRTAAGVEACNECVAEEVGCMLRECASPCGAQGSDDACRACACANGCTEAFGVCAGEAFDDVCADCNGDSCINMSVLPPELIMVVLQPVLFGAQVMMPMPVMP